MSALLRTKPDLWDLHCTVGLTDWDMDKELKLATTTDQFLHEDKLNDRYVVQRPSARASRRKDEFTWYDKVSDTFVKPSLWLWVDPNIVCPGQLPHSGAADPQTDPTDLQEADLQRAPQQGAVLPPPPQPDSTHLLTSHQPLSCPPAKTRRKGRTTVAKVEQFPTAENQPGPSDVFPLETKCFLRLQECPAPRPGCWPRPPVNYYILIALALMSNHNSGLKVQQIYHFTRENFPFFQTAPDGWKNSIRHNLCFNSSFSKTCNLQCRDGKRKSCFWHLTLDGQRRLRDEIRTLPGETLRHLERSMSRPDVIRTLLSL
ncbi:forkhead box protein R1 isoform X2 [Nelusetta ayraudi]|uniref:forkhead box protein R1 isoform X2 n=1 Tax=Nelusetta ayraudi TaxID=303726 RepID=UPI003F6FE465